jgi:hypothetical protein
MDKLSVLLLKNGFFSALGTTERVGGVAGEDNIVKAGTPYTIDFNNGVTVVYDEKGRPWIFHGGLQRGFIEALDHFKTTMGQYLKQGAYVPHSNDGGCFIHTVVLPALGEGGE